MGLTFEEAKTFRYYSSSQSACDFKMGLANKSHTQEIGLKKSVDGGYTLQLDQSYGPLAGLVGREGENLMRKYAIEVSKPVILEQFPGATFIERVLANGDIQLEAEVSV